MSFKIIEKGTMPKIPDNVISNVVSNLTQGNQAGEVLNECSVAVEFPSASGLSLNTLTNDLRIISPTFLPSVGGFYGTKALSQSLTKLYNSVVGSAYDTTNFSRADLGKHLFITEGFILGLDMIDRYLDTFSIRQYGNLAPDQLLAAQRFSDQHNGAKVDYKELMALRNQVVPLLNKCLIPSKIAWINKHRSLVRHVYADDIHMKTAFIVPIPYYLYWELDSNNDVTITSSWDVRTNAPLIDIIVFANALINAVQSYLDSAFYSDMSPYLWRSMCQENGPKIDTPVSFTVRTDVLPLLDLDVIFDYNIIQLVRNADYVCQFGNTLTNSSTTIPGGDVSIREDNDGNLTQGRYYVSASLHYDRLNVAPIYTFIAHNAAPVAGDTPGSPYDMAFNTRIKGLIYPLNSSTKVVNAEDFPSTNDTLYYIMNACVRVIQYKPTGATHVISDISTSGDTIFVDLHLTINTAVNQTWYTGSVFPVISINLFRLQDLSVVTPLKANGVMQIENTTQGLMPYQYVMEGLCCCPKIAILYKDVVNNGQINFKQLYVDKDNLVVIPETALQQAHQFMLYSAMDIQSGYSASSDVNPNKGKSKRRSKGKSSDKSKATAA